MLRDTSTLELATFDLQANPLYLLSYMPPIKLRIQIEIVTVRSL